MACTRSCLFSLRTTWGWPILCKPLLPQCDRRRGKGGIRSALRFQSTADSNERDKQFPSFLYELEGGQRQSPRCLELTQGLAELIARSYLKLRAFFFLRHWKMAAHEGGANLGFTWHVHRPLPLHWVSHSSFEEHCVPEHSTHKIHDLARGCKRRR